jgi:hypothetical protein
MSKTKKQIRGKGGLNDKSSDLKSKLSYSESSRLHDSAKRLRESLDKEKEFKKNCDICNKPTERGDLCDSDECANEWIDRYFP